MKTSFFICTFKRDFRYLKYMVRSFNKFVRGFHEVVILFPETDWGEFTSQVGPEIMSQNDIRYRPMAGQEWPHKGMLWHEWQVTCADVWCHDSDFICHFDSDCIFTKPVTPETFIPDGKPILRYERFETIGKRHPGTLKWKEAAESCLPFPVPWETMRGHPEVYHHGLYSQTRRFMEKKLGENPEKWVRKQRNAFPQSFAEYPTLGAVAMFSFPEKYTLVDMAKQPNPDFQNTPVVQFWGHGSLHEKQATWIDGKEQTIIPMEVIRANGFA